MTGGRARPWPALAAIVLIAALIAAAVAWRRRAHATREECERLLDRYVELFARQRWPEGSEAWLREQQARSREKAATEPSFLACPREVTRAELACAMAAPNVDELEKCLE